MSGVQVVLNVDLDDLAMELGSQVGEGFTYEDLYNFILDLDTRIADSEFTKGLFLSVARRVFLEDDSEESA